MTFLQNVEELVKRYITQHDLLHRGETVLVALSGGADSVALLRCLLALGFDVEAAHCNFHLRGDESDRDELFVRQLCEALKVQLHVRHFDTLAEVKLTGKSVEMAARDLRYDWFATFDCTVAVAHHKDDNAETMLLNLVRGTGIEGLTGMAPKRMLPNGHALVRPMLCLTREEILQWLNSKGKIGHLPLYVTDSTNNQDVAKRNVVRHHLLPVLRQLNAAVIDTLSDDAMRLRDAAILYKDALRYYVSRCYENDRIDVRTLLQSPASGTILYDILAQYGFTGNQSRDIHNRISDAEQLSALTGRVFHSSTHRLLYNRGFLLLRHNKDVVELLCPTLPAYGRVTVTNNLSFEITQHPATGFAITKNPGEACMDFDKLHFPLTIRKLLPGDRFTPFGMKGTKLVSDYLTDRHVSLFDKEDQLVLLSGNDIVWLVGHCTSARYAITPNTRNILRILTL